MAHGQARYRTVIDLFSLRAARDPGAPAVAWLGGHMLYSELDRRSNQVARRLAALGVGTEAPVGLFLERSPEAVVGLLGILKAGGVYVPLEPELPDERLRLLARDARLSLVLTREGLAGRLPSELPSLRMDGERDAIDGESDAPLSLAASEDAGAYVIYTSGSTGKPKGSLVSHRAIARLSLSMARFYELAPSDRVLAFVGLGFDASLQHILPPLVAGSCVVLRGAEPWGAPEFPDRIRELAVTAAGIPTTFMHELALLWAGAPDRVPPDPLRLIVSGGEAMAPERIALWRETPWRAIRFVNAYGPTEAAITVTTHEIAVDPAALAALDRVPIGRPIAGRAVHLLGETGEPVAPGESGEIAVGGWGLARGYIGRPDLTADRFRPDPFAGRAGARLYLTGDLGRSLPGGELDILGRVDDQVKIRGSLVQPKEVEVALREHPEVAQAVVAAWERGPGDRRLVAYVEYVEPASEARPGPAALRRYLEGKLPPSLVPTLFMMLDRIPLTSGGKVDRRALPAPGRQRPDLETPYAAPRGPLEEKLAALWAELFELDRVGIDDSFLDLGGNSLLAVRLATRARAELGLELPVHPFTMPTVAAAARKEAGAAEVPRIPDLYPMPRNGDLPASFSQERVWFLHQASPGSRAYHTQFTYRFEGSLDLAVLTGALSAVVARHEVYRTVFPAREGRPVQQVHAPWLVRLPLLDLSGLPGVRREPEALRAVQDGLQQPFDLERLPLLRWVLARLAERDHLLLVVEHHLVHDGWSLNVLTRDLLELYRALAAGRAPCLPALPVQFADFAAWQRRWLESSEAEAQLAYWRKQLADVAPLELPADQPRPTAPRYRGTSFLYDLPAPLAGALRELARRHGVTLFAAMLAAFDVLLHRYSGQTDLAVGSGVANRRLPETADLIGMIVNNVVLRLDLAGDPDFGELLARAGRVTAEAAAREDLPFDKVVEALRPPRERSVNPLFQAMLSFHNSAAPELDLPDLRTTLTGPLANGSAKFDLNLVVVPRAEQALGWQREDRPDWITVSWEYSSDLFDAATMARMIGHYRNLLAGAAEAPAMRISELPLLAPAETQQLRAEWGERAVLPAPCLDELFAVQAARTPDAPALTAGGETLTYRELARWAGHLARRLRAAGVGPEVRVAVALERSADLVAAILAVLAAGGAYVPLDPAYPDERLAATLTDCGAPVALARRGLATRLGAQLGGNPARPGIRWLDPGEPKETPAGDDGGFPALPRDPRTLAYVIYTSGSTGRPKGVAVSHASVARLFAATREAMGFGPADVWSLFHSAAFDVSVWELFGALLHGGRLVVVPRETAMSADAFRRLLAAEGVTILSQTPSAFRLLDHADETAGPGSGALRLRWVVFAGEALDVRSLASWIERHGDAAPALANLYGITETTVHSTWRRIARADLGSRRGGSPIGRPLADLEMPLLDRHLRPVPAGVPGEISVGGAGVARGYLGDPQRTAERFVPHPWSDEPGARLYRSGDLARRRPDGELEYLGRADQQVKVRGFRIEPGEVEAALAAHPAVRECVVAARADVAGDARLVAYLVPLGAAPGAAELRAFLKRRLPEYMVPSVWVPLASLPLTGNGKLDRKALPGAAAARLDGGEDYVAPRSAVEERLAAIWAELLGVDRVGARDDFFALGGHSLLATRMLHRVREAFAAEVPLERLLGEPTVEALAAELARVALPRQAASWRGATEEALLAAIDEMAQEDVDGLLSGLLSGQAEESGTGRTK